MTRPWVCVLGSNAATPAHGRFMTSQFLHMRGDYILLDCGEGSQYQLQKFKLPYHLLDRICITHLHGDHIFGLPGLLNTMTLNQRTAPLHLTGPPGLKEFIEATSRSTAFKCSFELHFDIIEPNKKILVNDTGKYIIEAFPLLHRVSTIGYRFEEHTYGRKILGNKMRELEIDHVMVPLLRKGMDVKNRHGILINNEEVTSSGPSAKSYAYCTDTAAFPQLTEYVKDSSLLYLETTFCDKHEERAKKTQHCTGRSAAIVAKNANAGGLLTGHYSARYILPTQILKEAREEFSPVYFGIEGACYLI